MKNLFNKASIQRHKQERSVVRNITGAALESFNPGSSEEVWLNDPIGTGLKSTQQLLVDWSDYSEHVFFNSAEGKVNLAFDQIINGFPFDGTSAEKLKFKANIGGFTKYILDQFATNLGYFYFNGNTSGNNVFLQIEDQTGKIAPDLAKKVGETKVTENFHIRGTTHEFWVYVPSDVNTTKRTLFQKKETFHASTHPNANQRGVSIYTERATRTIDGVSTEVFDISFHVSSGNFKAIKHTIQNLKADSWHHVAFVYERAKTERVIGYVNGVQNSITENKQAELDNIQMGDGVIRVGYGLTHTSFADPTWAASNHFRGLLDELRVWSAVRTKDEIKGNMHRNIDAQVDLTLYYRFNEPTVSTPYSAAGVVLDYSGNSLHALIQNLNASIHDPKGVYNNVKTPLKLEHSKDNPVLFPDWPVNANFNKSLLVDANQYDRNNPNLITKLVPHHYFEEAQFFEGIEDGFEIPKEMEVKGTEYPLPGHGKMPTRVVMLSVLLIWANFFDDIKLYIDQFSLLGKVSYDTYNQIPPQIINFLSDFYGLKLPNPYANENNAKFRKGENLQIDESIGIPLSDTLDKMWRRILVNLPWLLRSRGTLQGVKGLMNTLGIESDSVFRFREYGGSISKKITAGRKKIKKSSGFLDFSKLNYIESAPLWAYRHEPGGDDPSGGPAVGEIVFQTGDITISTPSGPPVPTLFTSGSWAFEGRYKLLKTETTASLFRIENDTKILANLVAMRAENSTGPDFNIRLFLDGHKTTSAPIELNLPDVNLWDENPWYISVDNKWGPTENTLSMRCIKTSGEYIVEHYSSSINYTKDKPTATFGSTVLHPGAPLFEIDTSSPSTYDYHRFAIGTKETKTYDQAWNYTNIPVDPNLSGTTTPTQAQDKSARQAQAHFTKYSGQLSHMRWWTKSLTRAEQIEHAHNPFSVSTGSPINSFAFPNQKIVQLNPGGTAYETLPLGKFPNNFTGTLPEGSWDRLRQSFDMLQSDLTFNSGTLKLIDTTQNGDDITLYGVDGGLFRGEFIFTVVDPSFDSNSTSNKIRIRSFQDKETAKDNFAHHGTLTELPLETGVDDRRFSIESSLVHALNDDIVNVLGNLSVLNNYLGAPELEYAVEYPEIRKIQDIYFQRLLGKVNYNAIIEFQRWFNNNFSELVEQFIPHTADFLGINFIIESHILERHKMEYKQGDVHVDIRDRQAFSQEPLFLGTIRSEIT